MINQPPSLKDPNIRIPSIILIKGRGSLFMGLGYQESSDSVERILEHVSCAAQVRVGQQLIHCFRIAVHSRFSGLQW